MGIISILEMLVDESESLVEAIVRDETAARDGLMLTATNTQKSIAEKDRQIIVLNQKIGDTEGKLLESSTFVLCEVKPRGSQGCSARCASPR